MEKNTTPQKKQWVEPTLVVYGDMTSLTQLKGKALGLGDDFAVNISGT